MYNRAKILRHFQQMYSEFDKKDSSQQTKSTDQLGCLKSELNIQQKFKKK